MTQWAVFCGYSASGGGEELFGPFRTHAKAEALRSEIREKLDPHYDLAYDILVMELKAFAPSPVDSPVSGGA